MSDLVFDRKSTARVRAGAVKTKKIKITINVDQDSIEALREIAGKSGAPYQKVLNQVLKEGLKKRQISDSRLERIEKEIAQIKKIIAA